MSTILDALRKSEQERKLDKLPTLTDMVAPQEPSRWPVYIGLVLVLVATALVVLAYIIWSAKPDTVTVLTSPAVAANTGAQGLVQAPVANADDADLSKDPMLVNVVSYSSDPALRFAMVNGKLVREGEFIEPGLKIEEIRADVVVFNSRGAKITRKP
ncbi:MAG: hypothetical protein ACI9OI_000830 [Chitinophagales bacterium]|jgi:hypothetical protein